mmetsp:Transcript_54631/g.166025  ORF Transcript_54631/g.166025 Transcript_54631/m.166025 type:complete len:224 (+) Transcript_54631:491-1162(+)
MGRRRRGEAPCVASRTTRDARLGGRGQVPRRRGIPQDSHGWPVDGRCRRRLLEHLVPEVHGPLRRLGEGLRRAGGRLLQEPPHLRWRPADPQRALARKRVRASVEDAPQPARDGRRHRRAHRRGVAARGAPLPQPAELRGRRGLGACGRGSSWRRRRVPISERGHRLRSPVAVMVALGAEPHRLRGFRIKAQKRHEALAPPRPAPLPRRRHPRLHPPDVHGPR